MTRKSTLKHVWPVAALAFLLGAMAGAPFAPAGPPLEEFVRDNIRSDIELVRALRSGKTLSEIESKLRSIESDLRFREMRLGH